MRVQPFKRWWIIALGLVLAGILLYAFLPFLKDEETYRQALEASASFALGRDVTITGEITLTLSLRPTLVLEHVQIANPPWASHPFFFQATRVEVQLALLPLMNRRLEVDKLFFDGVDLRFEEGPDESNNWTFGEGSETTSSPETASALFVTIPEEGFTAFQRTTISYQSYGENGSENPIRLIITEGTVLSIEHRFRKYNFRGTFREIPFSLELTGGRFLDIFDLNEPWPFDGVFMAAETTLKAKGELNQSDADPYLTFTGSLTGNDLSSLNPLLKTDLPDYGPYELITSLSLSDSRLSLEHSRLTVGQTDLAGLFIMDFKEDRTQYYSRLTGETLQTKDFQSTEPGNDSAKTSLSSPESFAQHIGMDDIDIDLELAVNSFLVDQYNLGKIALSAKLEEGFLSVTPFRAETFGGAIAGSFELDGNHTAPKIAVDVRALDWDYGQALKDLEVTSQITGSTDLEATVRGQGTTIEEFLDHSTLSIDTGPSSLMLGNEENNDKVLIGIHQATVKASQGGAVKARVKGEFKKEAIDIRLVTKSLTQLRASDKPWPISLLARSHDASLTLKGEMQSKAGEMRIAFAVSLRGQQLNHLDPDLPPSWPYIFKAQLRNRGSQYFLENVKGRVGQSDVAGSLSLNMAEDIPHLSAALSSHYLNMADISTPDSKTPEDSRIPVESLQALEADIIWTIEEMKTETVQLRNLTVDGNLKNGRMEMTSLQGELVDRKRTYGEFQGDFTLDTTTDIPTLSGKTSVYNLDFGYLLQRSGGSSQLVGTTNLDAHFSSTGNNFVTMLAQASFKIGTQDVRITLKVQQDEGEPFLNVTQAALSSKDGGPLLFNAKGLVEGTPFTITSSAGTLNQLKQENLQWPLSVAAQLPQLSIDIQGHILFPINHENFRFQVNVTGDHLENTPLLTDAIPQDLGPLTLTGTLTQIKEGYQMTKLQGQLGPNDVAGNFTFFTTGPRPKLIATLNSKSHEFGFLTKKLADSAESGDGTILKTIIDSVATIGTETGKAVIAIGSKAGKVVTKALGIKDEHETPVARIIPDFEFPVDALRSIDLDLDWQVQQLQSKGIHLGNISYKMTLENGLLSIGPLKGTLWHGAINGRIELDASRHIPTLAVQLTIQDLDLDFLDDTVGVTDLVKGDLDLIKLNLNGRGTTLHQVLGRANGEAELVEGPLEITNAYIDFWASDILTLAFTKAWKKEEVTKLNCAIGHFDIVDGEVQSDAILFDTQRITVGGFGTFNFDTEQIDLILTPQPKNPTLVSLSHPVRIIGPLSDPDVTSNTLRIAEGGGWYLLGLVNPIGLTLVVPKITGTTMGTGKHNPCAAAMLGKEFTVQEVSELQEDFWDWMVRMMKGVFHNNNDSIEAPPKNKNTAQ